VYSRLCFNLFKNSETAFSHLSICRLDPRQILFDFRDESSSTAQEMAHNVRYVIWSGTLTETTVSGRVSVVTGPKSQWSESLCLVTARFSPWRNLEARSETRPVTSRKSILLENLTVTQLLVKCSTFMEQEDLLQNSQQPVIILCI
jgi:hypothetical protein